jgi:nucleoside-triphosphatase
MGMKHLLIIGRPGVGKTTLMKRLAQTLRGRAIDGFLTEELREEGQRMGFWLSSLDGRQILLAHRRIESPHRVGPYRVNVAVLDDVAVPIIRRGIKQAFLLFLDELGKMELCSSKFEAAVEEALDRGPSIVATASVDPLPWLTAVKRRRDVELIPLSSSNWDAVEEELAARLAVLCTEDAIVRQLQAQANRICEMIVSRDVPQVDIEIQQANLREAVVQAFPEKAALYHLIYESRFRRLWQQFRHE